MRGGGDIPNKFVTPVCDDVHELTGILDIEEVAAEFNEAEVEEDNKESAGGGFTEDLGQIVKLIG
jgi:hypothetical protein